MTQSGQRGQSAGLRPVEEDAGTAPLMRQTSETAVIDQLKDPATGVHLIRRT